MKIIILAAGKGERLMPLTQNTPKPLLDLGNGNTLLEEQIRCIKQSEVIREIILVIGYLAEQIEAKIRKHIEEGIKIKTVFNPFFNVSNNLMSLWLAKNEMSDDFMITNGDNLFTPDVYSGLARNKNGLYLSVNLKKTYDFDDMKVTLQEGLVAKVSKNVDKNYRSAESPGLALIKGKRNRHVFSSNIEKMIRRRNCIESYWLEIFNHLHEVGVPVYPWWFDGSTKWQEVDFHPDVKKVKQLLHLRLNPNARQFAYPTSKESIDRFSLVQD